LEVDGLDYSQHLLARARARGTGPLLRYTHGDMRALPAEWTGCFDAVLSLSTSFGFFRDPADDAETIASVARVLKPGGILLWHGASRDGVVARFLARDWWTTSDGTMIAQARRFDALSGVMTVESSWSGPAGTDSRVHHLRLYTATRLAEMCAAVGLIVEAAWDGWRDRPLRRTSSEMLIVARNVLDGPPGGAELPRRRRRD
jgi:SAM-dependent methyltransferase